MPLPLGNVERGDPLRRPELVPDDTGKVQLELLDVDASSPDRLRQIAVQQERLICGPPLLVRADDSVDRFEVLDRSDFVVAVHDRHDGRVVRDRRVKRSDIERSARVDRHERVRTEPDRLEELEVLDDGRVLDRRRHDPCAFAVRFLPRAERRPQRPLVGLRAARREVDPRGIAPDGRSHLHTGRLDHLLRESAKGVRRRRVAVVFEQATQDILHLWPHRRRRIVIKVERRRHGRVATDRWVVGGRLDSAPSAFSVHA